MKDKLVLYHEDCIDGFCSAFVAYLKFGETADYKPLSTNVGELLIEDHYQEIYLLDISLPISKIFKYLQIGKKITIIDHHEQYINDYKGQQYAKIDIMKSACMLTFEHFFNDCNMPLIVMYVNDKHMGRFSLPDSYEVNLSLSLYPHDFITWKSLAENFGDLILSGRGIVRYQEKMLELISRNSRLAYIAGYEIPIVNSSVLRSDILLQLLKDYSLLPFVGCYYDRNDGFREWSFATNREDIDLRKVLVEYNVVGDAKFAGYVEEISQNEITDRDSLYLH